MILTKQNKLESRSLDHLIIKDLWQPTFELDIEC